MAEQVSLRNILLATDMSERSACALDYATGIARRYPAQLHMFHCVDPTPFNLAEDPEAVQTTCDDARRELGAAGKFEPAGFKLPLGMKDNRLVLAAAEEAAVPMPMASLVRDRFLAAMALGLSEADWSAIAVISARNAGLDSKA